MIVGGGRVTVEIERQFMKLAGGKSARIVVIPTASMYADQPEEERGFLKRWQALGAASVRLLHTRNREEANRHEFVQPLREATAVWISGGDQSRLTESYRGTAVQRELQQLLQRGGVIGGTSAGAAIMSEDMITGGTRVAKIGKGLGLLPDVVIDQHFLKRDRAQRLLGVLQSKKAHVGIGIDEATAVVVRGRALEVVGDSYVIVFTASDPLQMRVLKAGDRHILEPKR